jgi:hypothetical protein
MFSVISRETLLIHSAYSAFQATLSPMRLFVMKSVVEGTFAKMASWRYQDGFMVKWIFDAMLKENELCAPYSPNLWCTTNIVFRWTSWLSATTINTVRNLITSQNKADNQISSTLIFIILTPILGALFYAAYSTPPTAAHTIQPGAAILPIALFTSSLTLILLLPNIKPEALVVPLLPLSLMSCMRGGKDDLGDGAEWEWTVLLHTVVTS